MMTDDELAKIEARANAATPGPWERETEFGFNVIGAPARDNGDGTWSYLYPAQISGRRSLDDICVEATWVCATEADAELIVHAREDIPALVAEVRRLRAILSPHDASA